MNENDYKRDDRIPDIDGIAEAAYEMKMGGFDPVEEKDSLEYEKWKESEQSDDWMLTATTF